MARDDHRTLRRPIHWTGWGLVLLAAIALVLAGPPLAEWWTLSRLRDHGVAVPAQVTTSSIDVSGRYSVDVVHYEFQPAGASARWSGVERFSHSPTSPINHAELPRKVYSGKLQVLHLPKNPSVHRLDVCIPEQLSHARLNALLFLPAGVILGVIGATLLARSRTPRDALPR